MRRHIGNECDRGKEVASNDLDEERVDDTAKFYERSKIAIICETSSILKGLKIEDKLLHDAL